MVDYPNRTKRQAPCCLNFLFLVEESSRVESNSVALRYVKYPSLSRREPCCDSLSARAGGAVRVPGRSVFVHVYVV